MSLSVFVISLLVGLCLGHGQFFIAHNASALLKDALPPGVDEFVVVPLQTQIQFFGQTYSEMRVTNDGVLSFANPVGADADCLGGPTPLMAIYWADGDTSRSGSVEYGEFSDEGARCYASFTVWRDFGQLFRPASVVVVNWNYLPFNAKGGTPTSYGNGYQIAFASDGDRTFVFYSFIDIQWTTGCDPQEPFCGPSDVPPMAGFDRGDGTPPFLLPGSCNAEDVMNLLYTSNVQHPGWYNFQVDQDVVAPSTRKRVSRPNKS